MATRTAKDLEVAIVQAYQNGEGSVRMARRLGVGVSSVYNVLRRYDIKRRVRSARPRKFSDEDEMRIAERYAMGELAGSIAEDFRCSHWLVRTIAKRRNGGLVRGRGGLPRQWTDAERDDIVARYLEGASQNDIAALHHTSQISISRILRALGIGQDRKSGENHGSWKGGRTTVSGYTAVLVGDESPYAEMRITGNYVLEHRLLMAQKLGRPLTKHETVHHINGDKFDNRPENLQLRQGRHGKGTAMACADCGSRHIVHVPLEEAT